MSTASPYGALSLLVALLAVVALASSRDVPAAASQTLTRGEPLAKPSAPAVRALRDGETLDLNTATQADLVLLPHIGPALAQRIVDERERRGAFERIEDLRAVRGIGPVTYARVAHFLRIQRSVSHDTVSEPVKYNGTLPAAVSTNAGRSDAPTTTSRDHK